MAEKHSKCFADRIEPIGRILDFTDEQYVV